MEGQQEGGSEAETGASGQGKMEEGTNQAQEGAVPACS